MGRKKRHEGHADESWLLPYSDLMTLLLALFIVLFAASKVDEAKFQAIREAFATQFAGGTKLPEGGDGLLPEVVLPILPDDQEEAEPAPSEPDEPEESEESEDPEQPDQEQSEPEQPNPDLAELFDSLTGYIATNDLSDNMALKLSSEEVLVTLSSDVWFASGSAELTPEMRVFAVTLADLLAQSQKTHPINIIITGHTDDRPIHTAAFPSNWHLSVARAVNFMEIMLENSTFDPRIFSARGYGEYEPIDTSGTPEGLQHNRRVEVLLSLADDEPG
ncbi:MAG: OmpA family protein [Clostridiales bacterium]|jgi:chemotaxis protein MotB|nr:OmpA family protein [Clostridiales bacterium]